MSDSFSKELEEFAMPELIEKIIIGEGSSWGTYGLEPFGIEDGEPTPWPANKVVKWEAVRNLLDHSYSDGFGAPEVPAIAAYTRTYVIVVDCYDGATSLVKIPRHPIDHKPVMPGGG